MGNDLVVDMVMYGSDYLFGFSIFVFDYFVLCDVCWFKGDFVFW